MRWEGFDSRFCLASAFIASLFVVGTIQAGEAMMQAVTASPVTAVAPAVEARVLDVESECEEVSTTSEATAIEGVPTPFAAEATTQAAGCKACKDRTWCKCTYNGMRRASCNPCCYSNDIGVLTCLD